MIIDRLGVDRKMGSSCIVHLDDMSVTDEQDLLCILFAVSLTLILRS